MPKIRPNFSHEYWRLKQDIANIEGFLAERDIHLLALAAAHPTAEGAVLEIGAFRGKSTILLSKAAALAGNPRVVSCDPLTWCQGSTQLPQLARARLEENLRGRGVLRDVEFHQKTSKELGAQWDRPIRLLWLDGDHTYSGVKTDLELFVPHLADGGILLMHDVLSAWPGANRAFLEDVLASPHFGPCGINGNLGWAQYFSDPAVAAPYAAARQLLARRLRPLLPYQTSENGEVVLFGWSKLSFKLLRWMAQWDSVPAEAWLEQLHNPEGMLQAA